MKLSAFSCISRGLVNLRANWELIPVQLLQGFLVGLLILVGLGMMIRKKGHDGYLILSIILLVIYASASWWVWSFGCGYSARNMVEYYAMLSLPLAALLKYTQSYSGKVTIYILLIFFSLYNLKMIYSYGGCWFGDGDWDWGQYLHWLTKWPA